MSETLPTAEEVFGIEISPNRGTLVTDPIETRYNIPEILYSACAQLGISPESTFYISRFQGLIKPELTEHQTLGMYDEDRRTTDEISRMPDFIGYATDVDIHGHTDSACFWGSWEAAKEATKSSRQHREVARKVKDWYVDGSIEFNRYLATFDPANIGQVSITVVDSSHK